MSKPTKKQYCYNFGRVFFPGQPNYIPNEIRFQPLGNHVGNVRRLVKMWSEAKEDNFSLERVLKAADIHDMGKPQKFEIRGELNSQQKFKKYIYSFRGHRYLAKYPNDIWAETLARGHHDFSVSDISRDIYQLKKEQNYREILEKDPLIYARELYILEMCDQIEAELACRVIGDEDQAESRTFMEYTITPVPNDKNVYAIDPYPFSLAEIKLTFESWSLFISDTQKAELQKCLDTNREDKLGETLDKIVKKWWDEEEGKPPKNSPLQAILKPYHQQLTEKPEDQEFWYQRLANYKPNPMQQEVFEAITQVENPAILLKAPTGRGKFEAVLFPALAKGYRLILPLPARSLLEDQKERAEKYLKAFSLLNPNREVSLVIDTGSQMQRYVYWNGERETKPRSQNPRRHLYKGDVILTTLDKFLYRYFAFGDKQKSFVFPLRINQEKTLICFDEAHSYEDISFTNFSSLVKALYEAGRSLVLMTATMPKEITARFDYLDVIDFVDDAPRAEKLNQFQEEVLKQSCLNQRAFEWISNVKHEKDDQDNHDSFPNEVAKIILREWQNQPNGKIIIVVKTVRDAVKIYQLVKDRSRLNTALNSDERSLFLYHSRIADQLRPQIYQTLKKRDEHNQSYLLITTSAIEVGCDLNSDLLISEICPPENLIQRAGRCNRKGNIPKAKIIVVGDQIPKFANTLTEEKFEEYKNTLKNLQEFDVEKISACISREQHIDDYRVVELFSMLHDYVYSADLTCQPLHKRGLIPTRSWTPSVNLEFYVSEKPHSISVPIDRLCKGEKYANTNVYETRYDKENTKWKEENPLRWGTAYGKEITVKIYPNHDGVIYDVTLPEYQYNPELGFVDLPRVFINKWVDGSEVKLLYDDGTHKAIITYIKSLEATKT
ncbi:MAG: hypothetical protein RLZZ338_4191 [Cyanobacteriota bacterium]|jgi:CRISPR-associated endonuclease/helicase Cas3